ncbi:MAG: hypothetical protein KAW09_06680, partial [Thermoplasmata archaeon]|nr:hypothetical protein [Thermoplasmata archaeon]
AVADDAIIGEKDDEHLGWSLAGAYFSSDFAYVLASGAPHWDDASPSETDAGRVMVALIPEFDNLVIAIFMPFFFCVAVWLRRKRIS